MDKYIFLDIDGVLNSTKYNSTNNSNNELDINNINILKDIINKTNAKIIIISSRINDNYLLQKLKEELALNGIVPHLYLSSNVERSLSIFRYICENKVEDYCVIDDNTYKHKEFFNDRFIFVDTNYGLTKDYTDKIVDTLM